MNKAYELSTESIPGCVLQLYVWMKSPKEAGTYALASIGISALTTGYTSAMIAFDNDVGVEHRKAQPKFFGYIPDDHVVRGRCFTLMTLIGMLYNLSRSVGCALLAVTEKKLLFAFVGGESLLYFIYMLARRDALYWARIGVVISVFARIIVQAVVAFSGCIHLRHPYVGERASREERSDEYYCIVAPLLLVRSECCYRSYI